MQIDLDRLLASKLPDVETVYDEKDVIVYAIGVGYGMDPTDDRQLRFVYEPGLQVVPTMPLPSAGARTGYICSMPSSTITASSMPRKPCTSTRRSPPAAMSSARLA